jgi:hypothetical protein
LNGADGLTVETVDVDAARCGVVLISEWRVAGVNTGSRIALLAFLAQILRITRWEQEGLPVHRHLHKSKAAIYTYKAEIDAWWRDGHQHLKQIEGSKEDFHHSGHQC